MSDEYECPADEENEDEDAELNEEKCDPKEYEDYKKAMKNLNRKYAVTMIGSECCVIENFYNPTDKRRDIRFLSFGNFKNTMLNKKIVNPWRTKNQRKFKDKGSMWLASGFRKEYKMVLFDPSMTVNKKLYYNLFQGFEVKPEKGDWSLLRNHVKEIICGGDADLDKYVMAWMARIIQEPGSERPGTSLVFKGIQGCGKGTLINALGKIIGRAHYRHILQLSHLTGKFNNHLKDALLVFCDEVTWGGDRQSEGVLKGMITEPTIPIEQKGKDVLEIESHINFAIASNNDWIIPAGLEERRFCVLNVLPDKAGDREYFNRMYQQLNSGGYAAFMYDLLNYDRSGQDLRTIPRTAGLLEQIISSMSPVHKFWYQRLMDGTTLLSHSEWENQVNAYSLYNAYSDFCDSLGKNYKLMMNQFSRKLKDICPSVEKARPRINGDQTIVFVFPDLETCRLEFQTAINMGVDWEDGEAEPGSNDEC